MAETRKAFEGADGATATDALIGASSSANGTWTFSSGAKLEGSTGLRCVSTAVASNIKRFSAPFNNLAMSVGLAFRLEALPPKTFTVFGSLRSTGSGGALRAIWKTDGNVGLRGVGTTTPEVLTDKPLIINKQYWMTLVAQTASTGVGSATLKFYDTESRALVATATAPASALSFGTTAFNAFDLGFVNGDPIVGQTVNYDVLAIADGITTELMPASWSTPAAPTGLIWDGTASQPASLQVWDGTALQAISAVSVT